MKNAWLVIEKLSMVFAAVFFAGWFRIESWHEPATLGDIEFMWIALVFVGLSGWARIMGEWER